MSAHRTSSQNVVLATKQVSWDIVYIKFFYFMFTSIIIIDSVEECGHIRLPNGVDQPRISINAGFKRADLSCSKTGYVFSGEKDPTPQYCFKGQWSYEAEDYNIPGCQGKISNE